MSSRGMTLIELVVVVAIVGILAAIAYPSYQESIARSRRADAQSALIGMSAAMERYFAQGGTYVGAATGALPAPASFYSQGVPATGADQTYQLAITALTATAYTLRAKPAGAQANDKCGSFILNAAGQQNIEGQKSGVAATDCWRD